MGSLDILTCGHGETTINFDTASPEEVENAKKIITDMIKQGYLIIIENEDGTSSKVTSFDASKGSYIIKGIGEKPMKESKATAVAPVSGG